MVGSAYFVKLKMCMKNYNAEKIIFDKFTAFFNFAIFFTINCTYTTMVSSE